MEEEKREEDLQNMFVRLTHLYYKNAFALVKDFGIHPKQVPLVGLVFCREVEPQDTTPEPGPKPSSSKRPTKRKSKRTTYILRSINGALSAVPRGSHASPRGIFTVRGHYRHYKSGKVVWIAEYKKGTGKRKSKTYKVQGR